jgi:hypothetical protein
LHIDTGFVEFEFIPVFGESFLEGSGHRLYQQASPVKGNFKYQTEREIFSRKNTC